MCFWLSLLISGDRPLLCQLNGGSSRKGPGSLFFHICRNLFLVLVAQEEERETHGGEVKLLQEPGRFYTPKRKLQFTYRKQSQHTELKTFIHCVTFFFLGIICCKYSRHAEDPGVEIQGFNWIFNPQHSLLHHEILRHRNTISELYT